jgi:SMC interacting uncharacterized protein involved in chromosome segregation
VKVLSDDIVKEKLCEIFNDSCKVILQEMFAPIEKQLKNDIVELKASIQLLKIKLDERNEQMQKLQTDNAELSMKLANERVARDELEQYGRRENLIFDGISSTLAERTAVADHIGPSHLEVESSEVSMNKVITFCKDVLHIDIDPSDVSIAHRCKPRRGSIVPPILVRLVRRSKRDAIFHARMQLKTYNSTRSVNDRIYLNEDLTEINRKLLGAGRKAAKDGKLDSAWSSNCRIWVKTRDGRRMTVTSMHQLNELIR